MGLRVPNQAIQIPKMEDCQPLKWHKLECELVTPLYGGGVEAATIDLKMPIRASAIRGQLRFWWRLLAKHKWKLGNPKAIQNAEFALFGGMGDDDGGRASQFFIKVNQPKVTHHDLVEYTEYLDADQNNKKLSYVLFPAANAEDKKTNPHTLLKTDKLQFQLNFAFSQKLQKDDDLIQKVIETLQWWSNFGGLGARSRKGLGAVHVSESVDYPKINLPLTAEEVKEANCTVVFKGRSANALTQLQMGIRKLSDFRQGSELGRNKGSTKSGGRSRWPEPDAIRSITGEYLILGEKNHKPIHEAKNIFPRAMFGLPIIVKFKNDEKDDNKNWIKFPDKPEPKKTTIEPVNADRLASPLFIRPFYLETDEKGQKQWASCALVIPYDHIKNMRVSIGGRESYPVWTEDTAQYIRPIQDFKGQDPLDAFLKYFAV